MSLEGCDNNEHGRREDSNGEDGLGSRGEKKGREERGGKGRGREGEEEGEERMKRARERQRCGREYAEPQDWMVTEHEIRFM